MPALSLPPPPILGYAASNPNALSAAPQLLDGEQPDMASFAQLAGLLPGESAVVVLRIEVRADGHAAQVEIDVSSGSQQVDEAAISYVRALVWVPGRTNGAVSTAWVRRGVRLVG